MFKIGDFSKLTMVSIRMLRYYDDMGLFKPAEIDSFTGYRYYSAKQINDINTIVALRDMGFNVSEITIVLNDKTGVEMEKMFSHKKREINDNIRLEKLKLEKINFAILDMKKERVNMNYSVSLKAVPAYKVISLRQVIPSYSHEGILWDKMEEYLNRKNIKCGRLAYATYYDEGYKEGEVDVEIVMEVEKLLADEEGFVFKETDALEQVASMLVPGDYSNLAPAYNHLANWIEDNEYSICGISRQHPLKGPWNETSPENYLNEIQMPIKKL